ncbi:MAG: hypothetical protein EB082_13995 [Verrucomicrobia bacterium]|nr:hypothetical protein [Verrucomicrobiota bacterium]
MDTKFRPNRCELWKHRSFPPLHLIHVAILFATLIGQAAAQTSTVLAFQSTGRLAVARYHHAATLLPNGFVLVAGGYQSDQIASAELFNPLTGTWTNTGSMAHTRFVHTTTLLTNGMVLVAGGYGGGSYLSSAELFNPATGTWTPTGSLSGPRYDHTATLLPNGKVLVAGGNNGSTMLSSTELYDPVAGTWTTTGSLITARVSSTATLLTNGLVLIVGGRTADNSASFSSAEIFNPALGTWAATGNLNSARASHTATLMPNGLVLVSGGYTSYAAKSFANRAELFNPVTGTWTNSGSLNTSRGYHTASLLPNGMVLIAGGANSSDGELASTELFNATMGIWTNAGSLRAGRYYHTATALNDGRTLIVGGMPGSGVALSSAELFISSFSATTGLMAYYPFQGNANDASGNGNGGSVTGARLTSDRFGQSNLAYAFNGVSDEIVVGNSASLSPTNQVTVSAWVNPLRFYDNTDCVSKGSALNYFDRSYALQGPWADGKWRSTLSTPAGEIVVASSNSATLGQWSHVLMTYDGTTVNLYVNGSLSGSQTATGPINQNTEQLSIGSQIYFTTPSPPAYWFLGGIDDVRIYNRALLPAEVAQLFASEAVPPSLTVQPTNMTVKSQVLEAR